MGAGRSWLQHTTCKVKEAGGERVMGWREASLSKETYLVHSFIRKQSLVAFCGLLARHSVLQQQEFVTPGSEFNWAFRHLSPSSPALLCKLFPKIIHKVPFQTPLDSQPVLACPSPSNCHFSTHNTIIHTPPDLHGHTYTPATGSSFSAAHRSP